MKNANVKIALGQLVLRDLLSRGSITNDQYTRAYRLLGEVTLPSSETARTPA